ncbi:MAG: methyltransferase domain-containing protein [Kiritimatiellales bacterium]|nr:methyltransferase domain-containing protein [Kiritimatiellales bacterium]
MAEPFVYDGENLEAMRSGPNYAAWIFSQFKPYLCGCVAEVGAGTGIFTEQIVDRAEFEQLDVFEPASNLLPLLRKQVGDNPLVEIHPSVFTAADGEDKYDAIVYNNVLEHLEDDRQELKLIHDSLKPGGHVCILVPALMFLYSEHDRDIGHFRRYGRKELKNKVLDAGFTLKFCRYFDIAGVLPWLVVFKWLKRPLEPSGVLLYDRFVVPPMSRMETVCAPCIGKNVVLVAQRAE